MGYRDPVFEGNGSGGANVVSDSTPKQDQNGLFGLHIRDANPGKQLANIFGLFSVAAVTACILLVLAVAIAN